MNETPDAIRRKEIFAAFAHSVDVTLVLLENTRGLYFLVAEDGVKALTQERAREAVKGLDAWIAKANELREMLPKLEVMPETPRRAM